VKYAFLIYTDPQKDTLRSDEENRQLIDAYWRFEDMAAARTRILATEALMPATGAITVRVRGGMTVTTDGPFAETKEVLGGFYVLDCKDLDEALEFAAQIPSAVDGSIEVRPIMEFERPS
jgi:hypothetical protein